MYRCSNWLLLTFTICSSITSIRSSVPVELQHVGHRFPNTRNQSNKQILRDFDSSVDFEDDTYVESWIEESRSSVKWKTENYDSQWEPDNRAPRPDSGKRYLRVDRGTSKSFGVAILRSSNLDWLPDNSAPILMSFSYWIRSKWPNFNNLELYLIENGQETLVTSLSEFSDINNQAWQSISVEFSVTPLKDDEQSRYLVFYAYCGTNVEDAIAIDNIFFMLPSTQTVKTPISCGETYYFGDFVNPDPATISSPNYPEAYGINEDCHYTLFASTPGARLVLFFTEIALEVEPGKDHDFVTVYDGQTTSDLVLFNVSNTDVLAGQTVRLESSGDALLVRHQSDDSRATNVRWRASFVEDSSMNP